MVQRSIDGCTGAAGHDYRMSEEAVEQALDAGFAGVDMGAHGFSEPGSRTPLGVGVEREHGCGEPSRPEGIESLTCPLDTIDDHGVEGLTRRGLKGSLVALVNLDQVEQGSEHPVDLGQVGGTSSAPGLVESQGKGLDAGPRGSKVGLGGHYPLPCGVSVSGCVSCPPLKLGHRIDQRFLRGGACREVGAQPLGLGVQALL